MSKNILIVDNQHEDCLEIEAKIKAVYPSASIKLAYDGVQVLNSLEEEIPDFIIMDLDMPNLNGLETTKILTSNYPQINVIIISSRKTEGELLQMISLGARGFIEKGCSSQTYWAATESILNGKLFFSEVVLGRYIPRNKYELDTESNVGIEIDNESTEKSKRSPLSYGIANDDLRVLKYICDDLTNKVIATKLFIHQRGIEYKVTKLFKLTGTANRHELKAFALKNGWHKDGSFDKIT